MSQTHFIWASMIVALLLAAPVSADESKVGVVSNVLVLSDKVPDVSSPEAWKASFIKAGMSDKDKALAIWKTIVLYRHQTVPPREGPHSGCVPDPFKTIHVYGYGQCCCASSGVEGLARFLGFEARGRIIHLHSVPEVKIDGEWVLLDASVMNYFIKENGKLASVDDIRKSVRDWWDENAEYAEMRGNDSSIREWAKNGQWKEKGPKLLSGCPYYRTDGTNDAGWHGWISTVQEYDFPDFNTPQRKGDLGGIYDYGAVMGYKLNVQLRPGGKLIRNWSNKGRVLNGADEDLIKGNQGALGLQKKLGDLAPGRIGNGALEWNVPLADGRFRLSALEVDNVVSSSEDKSAPAPLHLKDATKAGTLAFRMPTSYVYLSGEIQLDAVVGDGGSIEVLVSLNNGVDWKSVQKAASGPSKINLTNFARGKYDYQVKFVLAGKGTGINSLKFVHDVQHAQTPLPILVEGDNTITFKAGPQEGTITVEPQMIPAEAKGNTLSQKDYHVELDGLDLNRLKVGDSGKGTATYKIRTPGEITKVRANAHYRARDMEGNDYYDVEASFDDGKAWQKIGRWDKAQPASNKYLQSTEGIPAGSKEVLIRLSGKQKNTLFIFDLRFDVDFKEPNGGFSPVKVTYIWTEDGKEKTDVHVAKTPNETWKITCGPKTVSKSFTVELAE